MNDRETLAQWFCLRALLARWRRQSAWTADQTCLNTAHLQGDAFAECLWPCRAAVASLCCAVAAAHGWALGNHASQKMQCVLKAVILARLTQAALGAQTAGLCSAVELCQAAWKAFHSFCYYKIGCWAHQNCWSAGLGLQSNHLGMLSRCCCLVLLVVILLNAFRTQCSQESEEILPLHAFKYTEELKWRKIKGGIALVFWSLH